MKKTLLFLVSVLCTLTMWAETIHVETPGTLKETLMDTDFTGTQLTITGTLNAADLSYIHDGIGRLANVTDLDISNIKVLPSDESYASGRVGHGENITTVYLYYSEEKHCDTIHSTNMLGMSFTTYHIYDNKLAGLFLDNTTYKTVSLPKFLNAIGAYMFEDSKVESITFPEAYTEIEDEAFVACKIKSIVLPKECQAIGAEAFYRSSLTDINLENVNFLGIGAFSYSNLSGDIQLGSLKEIPSLCFYHTHITSVQFSENLKVIGASAFSGNNYGHPTLSLIHI